MFKAHSRSSDTTWFSRSCTCCIPLSCTEWQMSSTCVVNVEASVFHEGHASVYCREGGYNCWAMAVDCEQTLYTLWWLPCRLAVVHLWLRCHWVRKHIVYLDQWLRLRLRSSCSHCYLLTTGVFVVLASLHSRLVSE